MYEDEEEYKERIGDKRLQRYQNMIYTKEERRENWIKEQIEQIDVNELIKKMGIKICKDTLNEIELKGKQLKYVICLSLYYASVYIRSGISIRDICYQLEVDYKKMMASTDEIIMIWSKKKWYKKLEGKIYDCTDKIRRIIYELDFIALNCERVMDENLYNSIIRNSENIYKKVYNYPKFNTARNNTLMHCCIYIGCRMEKLKIKKKIFCRMVNISLPTLNSYECAIQETLKVNK
jgi:transcription initiation factor TFIIIB Brf1 subunit/transcription initiation factor TFIIB